MHSKISLSLRVLTLASVLALPLRLNAADAAAPAADETPVHAAMEKVSQAWRSLNRGMRNPDPTQKTAYLESLQAVQAAMVEAKPHTPKHLLTLPDAERATALVGFRSDLAATLETTMQLERAILADDWEKAKELAAKIGAQRNDAHKKYNPEPPKG